MLLELARELLDGDVIADLGAALGVDAQREDVVDVAIERRMRVLSLGGIGAYLRTLRTSTAETEALAEGFFDVATVLELQFSIAVLEELGVNARGDDDGRRGISEQ